MLNVEQWAEIRRLRAGGTVLPPMAYTPLLDCRDGTWVLSPTLATWHGTETGLRAMWKNRFPQDHNARVSRFNHELADEASAVFGRKNWRTVTRTRDLHEGARV